MAAHLHSNVRTRPGDGVSPYPDFRAGFEQLAPPKLLPKGTVLFQQGQASRGVFLLTGGRARLLLRADTGRDVIFRTVGPGYALGLPPTILGKPYFFTADLLEDSQVAFIEAERVREFLRNRTELCFDVVRLLSNELMELPPVVHRPATRRRSRPTTN